jgi:uncharacterized protein (DUF1684 family)
MKQIFFSAILLFSVFAKAQECSVDNANAYRQQLNKQYTDPNESPLTKQDSKTFKSLDFYPVDMDYCVVAKLVRTPNEKPFIMPTTGNYKPRYVKYGELYFELKGNRFKLDVFQNLDMVKMEEYKDNLFLPFTDLTSGNGSYGGGRYIDLKQPEGDVIVVDFNRSYNPYCAYNPLYSCPIPPAQNDLQVEVKAGVKEYKKH